MNGKRNVRLGQSGMQDPQIVISQKLGLKNSNDAMHGDELVQQQSKQANSVYMAGMYGKKEGAG